MQVGTPISRVFTRLTRKSELCVEHRRVLLSDFSRDCLSLRLRERQLPLSFKTTNWFVYQLSNNLLLREERVGPLGRRQLEGVVVL
jgi:hypothetical protein